MNDGYEAEVLAWRRRYEDRLRAEDGWLSVTGLHWLEQGVNTIGTAGRPEPVGPEGRGHRIGLDCADGPAELGTFTLDGASVEFAPAPGALARFPELARAAGPIEFTKEGSSPPLRLGRCSLVVLRRGDLIGIRSYDNASPRRLGFRGTEWFPVDPGLRVEAEFRRFERPKPMPVLNLLGQVSDAEVPGELHFELGGTRLRLLPTVSNGGLFIVFRDGTSEGETYPAARFLAAEMPAGTSAVLDFNRAYHPPCAYTPHATCPLPFPENRLPVRIPAGERLP